MSRHLLFYTRLALYLTTCAIPFFHPSIAVPYDAIGLWMWFGLIPGEMLIAYYLSPPRFRSRIWLGWAIGLVLLSVLVVANLSTDSIPLIVGGVLAFAATALVFKTDGRGNVLAAFELFFLGALYFKFLSFSRASEETAQQSTGITQMVLILGVCVFLVHCLVLYRTTFQRRKEARFRREVALFFAVCVPIVLAIALLLPPDFVAHSVVFNFLKEEAEPEIIPLDETGRGLDYGGNLRSREFAENDGQAGGSSGGSDASEGDASDTGEHRDGEDRRGRNQLRGVPSESWDDQRRGEQGEDGKQYTVMVIASGTEPVYAAEGYYGRFDAQRGFELTPDSYLNELVTIRLLETWANPAGIEDAEREPSAIFYLSTIPDRVLAYQPRSVEPTVLKRTYHPFSYSYDSISAISRFGPQDWRRIQDIDAATRDSLEQYLDIPLDPVVRDKLTLYLSDIVGTTDPVGTDFVGQSTPYSARIQAIMESYSTFQYQVGFDEDVSVSKMVDFLLRTKTGDCTEFSNSAAILARMAGIPARVVTGYLAAAELQTDAHRQGLAMLQEALPPLQDYPPDALFLVTTAHRHSWPQFFVPAYGWVDFDPTSYAIPPAPGTDPASMDVVIPLIQELQEPTRSRFPWLLALRVMLVFLSSVTVGLYLYRYGMELYLHVVGRRNDERGLKALYRILLMGCAANGQPLKKPSQTSVEYADVCPQLGTFATLYTMLRYRVKLDQTERDDSWHRLRTSFRGAQTEIRKRGIVETLRRIFSLRGLYY